MNTLYKSGIDRRNFLKTSGIAVAGLGLPVCGIA